MASLAHRSKVRRAERSVLLHTGNINLVPLVDILTSIVFFSLLTYTGEQLMRLTAYDLLLPPQVITAEQARQTRGKQEELTLLLAVRVKPTEYVVEHSEEGGFRQAIPRRAGDTTSLVQLQQVLSQVRERYPQNADVTVVPNDEVSYDDLVHVLERARMARFRGISLASQARGERTASATTGATTGAAR
jgi:biopolymer transport protein ExbD